MYLALSGALDVMGDSVVKYLRNRFHLEAV
jgi:hypothetical protein